MARAGAAALMATWCNIGQQDRSMTVFKFPFHLFERQYLPPETSSGATIMVRSSLCSLVSGPSNPARRPEFNFLQYSIVTIQRLGVSISHRYLVWVAVICDRGFGYQSSSEGAHNGRPPRGPTTSTTSFRRTTTHPKDLRSHRDFPTNQGNTFVFAFQSDYYFHPRR